MQYSIKDQSSSPSKDLYTRQASALPRTGSSHFGSGSTPGQRRPLKKQSRARLVPVDSLRDIVTVELIHKPEAAEDRLLNRLIPALRSVRLDEQWPGLLPRRIGHDTGVDAAVEGFVKAQQWASSGFQGSAQQCLRPYVQSLGNARQRLSTPEQALSDETIIIVAILAMIERLLAQVNLVPMYSHMHGLHGLLVARTAKPNGGSSDIFGAVVFDFWSLTFLRPCILGTVSQLNRPEVYRLEWPRPSSISSAVATLRRLSNELFIRLPGLIAHARRLRDSRDQSCDEKVKALASELCMVQDTHAENEMLHQVRLTKTMHPRDATVATMSFDFSSIAQYEAAMYYWQTRLILMRLCKKLGAELEDTAISRIDQTVIARLCMNLLMSWQFTMRAGIAGLSAAALGIIGIWGALRDFPELFGAKLDVQTARIWLMGSMNYTMLGSLRADRGDMDAVSELFAGGPTRGRVIEQLRSLFGSKYQCDLQIMKLAGGEQDAEREGVTLMHRAFHKQKLRQSPL